MVASNRFGLGGIRSSRLATACVLLSVAGCSGKEPPPADTDGTGGAPGAGGSSASAGGAAPGNGGAPGAGATPSGGPACVTYAEGFLPRVHQPVCSNCHGVRDGLPDLGVAGTAQAECANIGNLVRRGAMPPDGSGYALTPEQRTVVADWVALGCPENAADITGSCGGTPTPGNGGTTSTGGAPATGNAPGVTGSVVIDRADWDPDEQTLRIEGDASDAQATLTAEFTGRTEPVDNAQGRFREEFSGVVVRPPAVTVRASSGASATAAVIVD